MSATDKNIETTVLVLQKVPYLGNKMRVFCLSPELGRMTFFVQGAENPKQMKGQSFDLFRKLSVVCHCNSGDLYYSDAVEILDDYSAVVADYSAYDAACKLAAFAVRYTQPNLAAGKLFLALTVALERLAKKAISGDAAAVSCNMAFLFEAGQLDYVHATEQERQQQKILLEMALGGAIPNLTSDVWRQLREWSDDLVLSTDM